MAFNNFKKILLAGTALVAVSAFSIAANAAALTSAGSGQWGSAGGATSANIANATAADTLDITATGTITILSTAPASDGSAGGTFVLGAVTNTVGVGAIAVTAGTIAAVNTVTISSANITGAFTVAYADGLAATGQILALTNALTVGGALSITSLEATAAETQAVTVGGALGVTGITTLTGGARVAGATTTALTVGGNATFTGAVTVTGGAGHATTNTATLTLNGATNAFTGGLTLADGGAGSDAILTLSGSVAQTVSGTIAGGSVGKININNALGATFSGTVAGALITIEKSAGNSSATFKNTVASAITLGGDNTATDVSTVTFDGTTAGFTVTGAIAGAAAAEINNIAVTGGNTITLATAATSNLDNLSITGTGTKLATVGALTVTNTTLASGTTLAAGANVTSIIDGVSAGVGTYQQTTTGAAANSIGATMALAAINVDTGVTLTASGAVIKATTTTLTGTGNLTLSGATQAVTTNIAAAVNGNGAVTIADGTGTTTMVGDIGSSANKIATLIFGDGGPASNTMTTTGNLYVNAITLGAGDVLQFLGTGAQAVSGTLGGVGATKGILTIGNGTTTSNVSFAGVVGGTTLASMGVSLGATANFAAGANLAGAFTSTGTTNFNGTATSAMAALNNTGTITVTGTGLVTATSISNTGNGVITLTGGSMTAGAGALTNATGGTITIAAGRTLTAATHTGAGTGTYNFGVSTDAATSLVKTSGQITLTGGATDLTSATINVTVPSTTGFIASGRAFLVVDGTADAVGVTATAVAVASDNSAVLSFTYVDGTHASVIADGFAGNSNNDVYLLATRVGYAAVASTTANDQSVGAALDTIAGTGSTELDAIQGQLQNATTALAVHNILESVIPTVDGSAQVGAMSVSSQVQGLADTRIASLRSGDGLTGMAAGASANGWNMWLQGYGQSANQDARGGVRGYDSNTLGGAVGIDSTALASNAILGMSFNYGRTNADSENANTTSTDVDNYGLNVYGSYDLGHEYFMNGQVGYAHNQIDIVRHNATGPGLGVSSTGDTDSKQYMAKLALGRDFAADRGLTMTPTISAAYVHLKTDGYTETGAGGASLIVDSDRLRSLKIGVGANAVWNMKNTDGSTMKPALRVGYTYDALNDRIDTTSSFVGGGGTSFGTKGPSIDRSAINAGAGLTYMTTANWDLSANYDYTYKANYDAHTGTLRATSRF